MGRDWMTGCHEDCSIINSHVHNLSQRVSFCPGNSISMPLDAKCRLYSFPTNSLLNFKKNYGIEIFKIDCSRQLKKILFIILDCYMSSDKYYSRISDTCMFKSKESHLEQNRQSSTDSKGINHNYVR